MPGPNRTAVNKTITALTRIGHLEDCDAAIVAAAKSLADAVDNQPESSALWREYRAALETLAGVGARGGGDDVDRLLEAIRSGAPVGDSSHVKPADTRRRSGSHR